MSQHHPGSIVVSEAVEAALAENRPVVALESTIISHGFPRPRNLEVAQAFEQELVKDGVTPATIAVIDGVPHVGLDQDQLHRIATDESVVKVSSRDLGPAMVARATGATTVAATALLAHRAGIRVFATGGLGGVHRGAAESYDESADLVMVSRVPVAIVSAGVKSILDVPATLERLETLGVTVVGYRTTQYPGFYLTESGNEIDWAVNSPDEIAQVMRANDALDLTGALLVANPLPKAKQLDPELHDRVLAAGLAECQAQGIRGKDATPFLLAWMVEHTGGTSMDVNLEIALNNIRLGGQIARAWAGLSQ